MKALTVRQPWAQLLVSGAKLHEIRSWQTCYRGPLLIHAGLGLSDAALQCSGSAPFREALARCGFKSVSELPRGVLLGTICLEDCLPCDLVTYYPLDPRALEFSDFRPGYWAWTMTRPQVLPAPIRHRGQRGLFDVPDALLA
jgi:hypothetical protein